MVEEAITLTLDKPLDLLFPDSNAPAKISMSSMMGVCFL